MRQTIPVGNVRRLSVWESDAPRNRDWHILLCMNDENGNETGRIEGIDISTLDGDQASFSAIWAGVKGRIGDNFVKISRRKYPITGFNHYVGNIYWNLVTVTPEVGAAILKWLETTTAFECQGGTVKFLERYGFE